MLRESRRPTAPGLDALVAPAPLLSAQLPPPPSFIVLEYLGGGTLRSCIEACEGQGLALATAMDYGQQLASALAYMHDDAVPGT